MSKTSLFEQAVEEYESGKVESAMEKLDIAASSGDVNAMEMLAVLYGDGDGVDYDFDKSIYWDKKAIEAGSQTSLSNLAITYRTRGDIRESKKWFEKAVSSGDGDAALELAKLYMVTDKENDTIKRLLEIVISSDNVCEASFDEAMEIANELGFENLKRLVKGSD